MILLRSYFFLAMAVMFACNYCYAQDIPDSVLKKLNNASTDSARVIILLETGESIEASVPATSFNYYQQALVLSKKINNIRCILSSLHDIGLCYMELNKLDSSIITFEQAIPFARQLKDTVRVARILGNIGNLYLHKKDPATAIDYYLQSARLWETAADQQWLPSLYSNINGLLNDQQEYTTALEYGSKAVTLARKIGDSRSEINGLFNLSESYGYLGNSEKQYELLQEVLPLARKSENNEVMASVYNSLGGYYFKKQQYQLSLTNYLDGNKHVQQMGNKYLLSSSCAMLAQVYFKLKQNGKALQYIQQAEKVADEVGARADLKEIYHTRAEIEQQAGNHKLANEYFSKTLTLTDSLFKAETSEKVADIEGKYQNEKKRQEILQLEKDKKIQSLTIRQKSAINYILFGSVAALLIVGFLGYRNLQHRQKLKQQRIIELEKDRQLIAVDSLLKGQEEERSRLAKDLHDGLGGLLSGVKFSLSNMKDNLIVTPENMVVFDRSLDMIDTSIKELRRVAHNMMPEMLTRFGLDEALKEYCNTINAAKLLDVKYQSLGMETRLDKPTEIIIYRIVQELLNNVLKHAGASKAFMQIIRENDRLSIVVEDNGKGFDTSLLENNKGAGWANIRSRVEYLKGQLDVHSETGKGALVNIEFNV